MDSSPELDEEDKEKEALDEEFFSASIIEEARASQNISTAREANAADFTDDEEPIVAKSASRKRRIKTSRPKKRAERGNLQRKKQQESESNVIFP